MTSSNLTASHLILHVADTDATIDFWCKGLGGELSQDEEMCSPALDAIFGREGVRIRDTFFTIASYRIHTIETLDVTRTVKELAPFEKPLGLTGLSFQVNDLNEFHHRMTLEGRSPTEIYCFDAIEHPVRMFFINDPNGLRVELMDA